MDLIERKKKILTFLLKKDDQYTFRDILFNELDKKRAFMNYEQDDTIKDYNNKLNEMIINSKINAIKTHTDILKEQMEAQKNGSKYPSTLSIIERKIYIVELQIDVGIYYILQNKKVKFNLDI